MSDTGYDYRYDEYEQPCIIFGEARDLDELSIMFTEDFADLPFTPAEEEMLPADLTTPIEEIPREFPEPLYYTPPSV